MGCEKNPENSTPAVYHVSGFGWGKGTTNAKAVQDKSRMRNKRLTEAIFNKNRIRLNPSPAKKPSVEFLMGKYAVRSRLLITVLGRQSNLVVERF